VLRGFGFRQFRVRVHDAVARIEVGTDEIPRLFEPEISEAIHARFRKNGFLYVAVDLKGYRTGSMNEGLPDPCAFYHANSFAPRPSNAEDVLGTADYGSEFVSVVERPPVYGLQSHPEKSGPDGLRLLRNFVGLAA